MGGGAEGASQAGPWIDAGLFAVFDGALAEAAPDRDEILWLWGRIGPLGQQQVMGDPATARLFTSIIAHPAGAGAEGGEEGPGLLQQGLDWLTGGEDPANGPDELQSSIGSAEPTKVVAAAPAPAVAEGAPAAVGVDGAEPAAAQAVTYADQRDNTYEDTLRESDQADRVVGDNMCNVTCLAMQLVAVCGGKEAVNRRTAELIEEHGGAEISEEDIAARQPEDLLMTFFDALTTSGFWADLENSTTPPFYKGWMTSVSGGWKFHQAGACQAYVLKMYNGTGTVENQSPYASGYVDKEKVTDFKGWYTDVVKPELLGCSTMTLSTKLTGGHFVLLLEVRDDGVVVNDPYGARGNSGYLKNGSTPTEKFRLAERDVLARRFQDNADLASKVQAEPVEALGNWGERNFFDWDEISKWKIGISGVLVTGEAEAP